MNILAQAILSFALLPPSGSMAEGTTEQTVGTIAANVDVSEWGPPGTVDLDLSTGRYELQPAAPRGRRRVASRVLPPVGTIGSAELAAVRHAYEAATAQGLVEPACQNGGPPPRVVVTNAVTPFLQLTRNGATLAAPRNRGCWTVAADRLHRALEATFAPPTLRR